MGLKRLLDRRRVVVSAEEIVTVKPRSWEKPLFSWRSAFDWICLLAVFASLVIGFILLTEAVGWAVDKAMFWN